MKRYIALLLAVVMLLSLMCACSTPQDNNSNKPEKTTVEETVIYNKKDIKITVTDINSTVVGIQLSTKIENASQNNIVFVTNQFIVNGITISGGCLLEIPAGGECTDAMYFYSNSLKNSGITAVATVKGKECAILDGDTYEAVDVFDFDLVTSLGADYEQPISQDGEVLLDVNGIKVLSQPFIHDTYGQVNRLLLINSSNRPLIIEGEDIRVNGKRVDGKLYDTVYPGSVRYSDLALYSSNLKAQGIDSIETISFKLLIMEKETELLLHETEEIVIRVE